MSPFVNIFWPLNGGAAQLPGPSPAPRSSTALPPVQRRLSTVRGFMMSHFVGSVLNVEEFTDRVTLSEWGFLCSSQDFKHFIETNENRENERAWDWDMQPDIKASHGEQSTKRNKSDHCLLIFQWITGIVPPNLYTSIHSEKYKEQVMTHGTYFIIDVELVDI